MNTVQKDILPHFRDAIDWEQVLGPECSLVCAFSGGPDSTALLDLLDRLRDEFNFQIIAAHLNHGIRGSEADEDEEFAKEFCSARHIPLQVGKADVSADARNSGLSLEMAARSARYEFFGEITARIACNVIVLGHTANDRVETLLMRLLRGSGGRGLGALQPLRQKGFLTLVRPLLDIFRHEIIAYLDWRGISYRTDSTNMDTDTDRGRVRNTILPGFLELAEKSGWEKSLESLARSGALLSDDEAMLQAVVEGYMSAISTDDAGGLHLSIRHLGPLAPPILARLILSALERIHPSARLERSHIEAIIDMVGGKRKSPLSIPGNLQVETAGDSVIIRARDSELQPPVPVEISVADLPGKCRFGVYQFEFIPVKSGTDRTQTSVEPSQERMKIRLPDGCESIIVRSVRRGDRMTPSGMNGHTKKLSDIYIDRKVPRRDRPNEPVLASEPDGSILAIPGLKIVSEIASVQDDGTPFVLVTFQRS